MDARTMLESDRALFANAASFEALELAPLAPLGSCSVVAPTSQNRVVSTVRGTEVVSDPTNVLALECARRLRADPNRVIRLAASQRCVRAQPVPDEPGFAAHFRLFCLATAAHETKDQETTVFALRDHIQTHFSALNQLEALGYSFPDRTLTLLSTRACASLARRVGDSCGSLPVTYGELTQEYYAGIRFMINAGATTGHAIPLIDGGCFDWVAKLAANRKLVYVASALGSQLVAFRFGRAAAAS